MMYRRWHDLVHLLPEIEIVSALAKGEFAMTIASRLEDGASDNRWLEPGGEGAFCVVREPVPTSLGEP
jgi:hypothetical protein